MSDYINRAVVMERTVKRNSIWNKVTNASGQGLEEIINEIPSEDVEPVRHGHWIEDQDRIVCSECGARFKDEIIYMQENKPGAPHRCLECGAIMDQEVNECLA